MAACMVPAVFALTMAATPLFAQAYMGVSAGQGTVSKGSFCLDPSAFENGEIADGKASCDENAGMSKIYGGYHFNENFSAEFGFARLGSLSSQINGDVNSRTLVGFTAEHSFSVIGAGVVHVPLGDFSIIGKGGLHYWRGERTGNSSPGVEICDESETNPCTVKDSGVGGLIGVGFEYRFTREFGVRLEYERYMVDEALFGSNGFNVASLGIVVRF